MRALSLLALALAAGCTTGQLDFVEVHGSMASGAVISGRVLPNIGQVPSLQPQLGIVIAVGAPINGPEDFRGIRLEWIPDLVTMGGTYPSAPDGPVIVYAVRAPPDAGTLDTTASVINGGSVTFTQDDAKKAAGTMSGLVLSRAGVTILTIDSGQFSVTKP
jgi:hypothetical protein